MHSFPSRPVGQMDNERRSKRRKVQEDDKEVILFSCMTSLICSVHRWLA